MTRFHAISSPRIEEQICGKVELPRIRTELGGGVKSGDYSNLYEAEYSHK